MKAVILICSSLAIALPMRAADSPAAKAFRLLDRNSDGKIVADEVEPRSTDAKCAFPNSPGTRRWWWPA